eukprot:1438355-Pleurochrysis_carterae.AAC.1
MFFVFFDLFALPAYQVIAAARDLAQGARKLTKLTPRDTTTNSSPASSPQLATARVPIETEEMLSE